MKAETVKRTSDLQQDNFPAICFQFGKQWRVVEDRLTLRWLYQRREREHKCRALWQSKAGFHHKEDLTKFLSSNGLLQPDVQRRLRQMPSMIGLRRVK